MKRRIWGLSSETGKNNRVNKSLNSPRVSTHQATLIDKWSLTPTSTEKKKSKTGEQGTSSFASCPICERNISISFINTHVDSCLIESENKANSSRECDNDLSVDHEFLDASLGQESDTIKSISNSVKVSLENRIPTRSKPNHFHSKNIANVKSNSEADTHVKKNYPPLKDPLKMMMSNSKALSRNLNHFLFLDHEAFSCMWYSSTPAEDRVNWFQTVKLQIPHDNKQSNSKLPRKELLVQISSSMCPKNYMEQQFEQEWKNKYGNFVNRYRFSPSVLKSALQKNVRRCRPESAVRCALALLLIKSQTQPQKSYLKENMVNLIRRLLVIALEDACLIADVPWLCWYMMALTKNYTLDWMMIERLLAIVYHIGAIPYRDPLPSKNSNHIANDINEQIFDIFDHRRIDLESIIPHHATLIFALMTRITYGGMTCDIEMFREYVHVWYNRFFSYNKGTQPIFDGSDILMSLVETEKSSFIDAANEHKSKISLQSSLQVVQSLMNDPDQLELRSDDIHFAAIDFHCSSQLEVVFQSHRLDSEFRRCVDQCLLESKAEPITDDDRKMVVKRTIWMFSSSVYEKQTIREIIETNDHPVKHKYSGDPHEHVWSIIENTCHDYSRGYISGRFKQ